ncbi:MAG: molybdenum cofactor guanylyltransferase MobA [Beijerinckiaceae bacterium]|jgi:molybdopterin-guanine dinucleotide biosynthesis protein A|nr:molybdenum cofactor guanylyltransferase MobA [Beijerinckiaceae bacterium]
MDLAVVILAGGKATRMGGGDKPLKVLKGVPILSHVLARVARQGRALVLNANGDAHRFAPFGLPVVADAESDFPGPLAGILAGLDWAASQGITGDVLSVPGDCPFIPHDLAERLEAARQQAGLPLACAGSGGWTHPVIGLWPVSLREDLRAAMAGGERKIDRFTARFGCATAEWPVEPFDPFFNVNTPEELVEAEHLAALVGGPAKP